MKYILICYKSNSEDYSMGVCMGRTDSDHDIEIWDDENIIISQLSHCLVHDHYSDDYECDWEYTLFIDSNKATPEQFKLLFDQAETLAKEKIVKLNKKMGIDREKKETEQKEYEERQEIAELKRLQDKYVK